MANTLRIKRRAAGGAAGAPATLAPAEIAFNEVVGSKILYYGYGDNGTGGASSVIAIGGPDFTPTAISNLTGVITSVGLVTSIASQTGTGSKFVVDTSPTLITPALGTPSSGTLTNCTFPTLNQNTTGNAATVTTNANLTGPITSVGNATSIASQTGSGTKFVVDTSPVLVTPNLGTPSAGTLTNCTFPTLNQNTTGNADTVTTNANLTGPITSVGNATSIASQTGSGSKIVCDTSPTLVTPNIGAATGTSLVLSGDLTVNGTTTTLSSATLDIGDKNIVLASAATLDSQADGGGITLRGATDHTWNWVDATDAWTSSDHVNVATTKAYYIAGTSVLNATTLGAAVVASSLTSVGTLTSGSLGVGFSTVAVARGGSGAVTLTGLLKGNGTAAFTAAVVDTDYLSPSSTIDGGFF
jgi:hypothetical protein